jgi:hypothetical protein
MGWKTERQKERCMASDNKMTQNRKYKRGKYHCTIDLLFDWSGLVCFANKNKYCQLSYSDSKPVKQEVNITVILPPLVFPAQIEEHLE